jgi:hypothetical protein
LAAPEVFHPRTIMFFDNSPNNKNKNKNVSLHNTQLPKPKEVELASLYQITGNPTVILDIECYPNYFEIGIKFIELNQYVFFEIFANSGQSHQPDSNHVYSINGFICSFIVWRDAVSFFLHRFLTVGFNTIYYDLPLIFDSLKGSSPEKLKSYSNEIIQERKRAFSPQISKLNHIDIMEVAPLHDGLKTYAGRIHAPRMQELPYEHFKDLTPEQAFYVRSYNVNDLDNTELLFLELKGQIRLREKLGLRYGLDLRSKSDAQVAEAVIQSELSKNGIRARAPAIQPGSVFRYSVPDFIQFKTPQLQRVLEVVRNTDFIIGNDGSANTPKEIRSLKIKIGGTEYQMGNGGLHSKETCRSVYSTNDEQKRDLDVGAYYPNIILNQNLYPQHLGPGFCTVYKDIIDLRKECKNKAKQYKEIGDLENSKYWDEESSSLKILSNGSFGKFGNKYSILYSPQLVTQTTVSGQLFLLMLIEDFELNKFSVISANTDGIVINVPTNRDSEFKRISNLWEKSLGFELEETIFKSLHQRDINNFIGIKMNNEIKEKGIYSKNGSALNSPLSKNPETRICVEAVEAFLLNKTPISETVCNCRDITKFVSVRKVEGGAQKNGQYLGKVITMVLRGRRDRHN